MERAKPRVVLSAGLFQPNIIADDLDDVGLLLDGLGEIAGHGRDCAKCKSLPPVESWVKLDAAMAEVVQPDKNTPQRTQSSQRPSVSVRSVSSVVKFPS